MDRIKLKLIFLLLFVALAASGWGNVFAAAFCVHAANSADSRIIAATGESCHVQQKQLKSHCDTAMGRHEMATPTAPSSPSTLAPYTTISKSAHGSRLCGHCIQRSLPVPASLKLSDQGEAYRTSDVSHSRTANDPVIYLPAFAARIAARQGSPPGANLRRHLIFSAFLI